MKLDLILTDPELAESTNGADSDGQTVGRKRMRRVQAQAPSCSWDSSSGRLANTALLLDAPFSNSGGWNVVAYGTVCGKNRQISVSRRLGIARAGRLNGVDPEDWMTHALINFRDGCNNVERLLPRHPLSDNLGQRCLDICETPVSPPATDAEQA